MDFKFDKMTVDTSLAENYLQREKQISEQCTATDYMVFYENKYYIANTFNINKIRHVVNVDLGLKLKKLAAILKENTELLAQLEYLIRKIPIEDTIAQVNLMVQQLCYVSQLDEKLLSKINDSSNITIDLEMSYDTHLSVLGYIPKILVLRTKACCITTNKTLGPLCCLFTKLCNSVDVPVYTEIIVSDSDVYKGIFDVRLPVDAVGVISELSDVDSAVDVFLTSPKQVPWRLQKILVQESVYQQFKNAITWKCNLNKQDEPKTTDTPPNVVEYNDRLFLMDAVDITELKSNAVAVEAYRTRKELLSMLDEYEPHYLSLWANDIAEINEISHRVSAPVVWVNTFGYFIGPPKVSEAVYPWIFTRTGNCYKYKTIRELKQCWLRLDIAARREILCNALNKCAIAEPANTVYKQIKDDLLKVELTATEAFIDIEKDYVCLGSTAPSNRILMFNHDIATISFFKSVLQGNAFCVKDETNAAIISILGEVGVPVIYLSMYEFGERDGKYFYQCDATNDELVHFTQITKIIWTNSGTIFGN